MKANGKLHLIRYTTPAGTEGSRLTRAYHETVRDLIDLGDLSALGDDLATTQAYGRDFGESNTGCRGFSDLEELRFEAMEYSYVLTPSGWVYSNNGERFRPFPTEFLAKYTPCAYCGRSFPTSEQC